VSPFKFQNCFLSVDDLTKLIVLCERLKTLTIQINEFFQFENKERNFAEFVKILLSL